jgi:hypothetical protein
MLLRSLSSSARTQTKDNISFFYKFIIPVVEVRMYVSGIQHFKVTDLHASPALSILNAELGGEKN